MRAAVTGASGFVGSALARGLLAHGFEVRALVRRSELGAALAAAGASVHTADLGDPNTIADAADGCELLFHCAGESELHASQQALSWLNVAGTENALRAARHAGVRRVVMLSCADVSLGNRDRVHWKENAVLGEAPLGAWARSKLLGEELALHQSDARMSVTALRPAFLWGPGDHTNLPRLCREAERGGVRLFASGAQLFATTYIDNLVEALCSAANAHGAEGHAFHVADAEPLTAAEFFGQVCSAVGLGAPRAGVYPIAYATAWLRRRLERPGAWPEDVARRGRASLLDCLRAYQVLGYQPKVGVAEGMAALATWAKAQGGPSAIAKLARDPAGEAQIARHRRLADELDAKR